HDGEIDPAIVRSEVEQARRDREIQHRADKDHATADPVGKPAPGIGTEDSADAGTHEHGRRLTERQLPWPDQEGEHKADQEVVEEFKRIADNSRDEYLDLIAG